MKNIIFTALVIISLILCFLSISIINDNKNFNDFEYQQNTTNAIYYKLNAISTYYSTAFLNKLEVWKAASEKEITTEKIKEITNITNLKNEYCERLDKEFSIDNAIACIDQHYKQENMENYLRVEIEEIKELRKNSKASVSILTSNVIYYLEDMDRISIAANKNYKTALSTFKELKNNIENDLVDLKKNS